MSTDQASPDALLENYRSQMHVRLEAMKAFYRPNDPPLQFCQELMGFIDTFMDHFGHPVTIIEHPLETVMRDAANLKGKL